MNRPVRAVYSLALGLDDVEREGCVGDGIVDKDHPRRLRRGTQDIAV